MKTLDRKLLRDLWKMRGQALAISLVIVSGVAVFVMSLSVLDSLLMTRESYYKENRFADVFASLKRAPESVALRIREIPGVKEVETRVVASASLDIEGFEDPVTGLLVSIPDDGASLLNLLYIRHGRLIEPDRNDEMVVSETFAKAHGLKPGDKLAAIINGRRKSLTIVGLGLSPEYMYQIAPGAMFPDPERYGVMWMGRTPLGNAYDMKGAFNDVALTLSKGARSEDVIDWLDDLLAPYGGWGAYGREDQLSSRFLSEEFKQLRTTAVMYPVIFLGVAAFLLNVVISRLVSTEREQIAALKALGYSNMDVGTHYMKLVLSIVLIGSAGGLALGVWLGYGLGNLYIEFFNFPSLYYVVEPRVVIYALLVSVVAAVIGTLRSVRNAASYPPAQAMRPQAPAVYRATIIERAGLQGFFSQPTRMIVRHIERRPVKSLLSIIGIAFACAIMTLGNFQLDAINYIVSVEFGLSQREDMAVTFVEPASKRSLYSLKSLQGVEHVEGFRAIPVRLRFEHKSYLTSLQGIEPDGRLYRVLDTELEPVEMPREGIILTDYLGKLLGVEPGDILTMETLEGARPVLQAPVVALATQYIGVSAYISRVGLNRLMREGDVISGAYMAVDSRHQKEIYRDLKEMPRVAGVIVTDAAIESFYETLAETTLIFISIITMLGGVIAFGVIYNTARIALSERSAELASLRVLGFTKGEIGYILLGELAVVTLAAIPMGFLLGYMLSAYIVEKFQNEMYRIPLVLEPDTYAYAAVVVLVSACVSGYLIWRQLSKLDLVAVLKVKV